MSAVISPCGQYRYRLQRGDAPRLAIVMLNPSTADAELDDPTIRRCKGFAAREGYQGIDVMNLYAYRATKPRDLSAAGDPEGPDNLQHLWNLAAEHKLVLCAWGANADDAGHVRGVCNLLQDYGARLVCLGVTASGAPRHPLYVRGDAPLEDFRP